MRRWRLLVRWWRLLVRLLLLCCCCGHTLALSRRHALALSRRDTLALSRCHTLALSRCHTLVLSRRVLCCTRRDKLEISFAQPSRLPSTTHRQKPVLPPCALENFDGAVALRRNLDDVANREGVVEPVGCQFGPLGPVGWLVGGRRLEAAAAAAAPVPEHAGC